MKKLCSALIALLLAIGLATVASADVIWEPYNNSFYNEHRDDFRLHEAYYYANSPTGAVPCYAQPGAEKQEELPNGTLVYIHYLYTADGTTWGMMGNEQYVDMDKMLNRHDDEFFDDHPEVTDTLPEGVACLVPPEATLYTWTYPGGVPTQRENYWQEDLTAGCTSFYTDGDGLVWGYINYWFGHQNCWVCLSDPSNPDLAQPEIHQATVYFGENAEPTVADEDIGQTWDKQPLNPLYIILPLAAAAIAAALLFLWPKKKKERT